MTGIERLRELIEKYRAGRECDGFECEELSCGECMAKNVLEPIADQIEREQDAMVADSPYDALPPEDREAIAWVREHGGIEYVKDAWNVRSNLARQLEKEKAKVARQQLHIEFVQRKCRERQEHICELNKLKCAYIDALNGVCKRLCLTDGTGLPDTAEVIWTELDRRLMPEGMEWLVEAWPRFEDGEPVSIGDQFAEHGGCENIVDSVEVGDCWFKIHGFDGVAPRYSKRAFVKRPAPKVLDADGAEIRAGETLYHVGNNDSVAVRQIMPPDKFEDTEFVRHFVSEYTHRAPVLAADGKPLREGETVWGTGRTQHEFRVLQLDGHEPKDCGRFTVLCRDMDVEEDCRCDPSLLTHERPDSFQKLWDDLSYGDVSEAEFMRRAKRLAGGA